MAAAAAPASAATVRPHLVRTFSMHEACRRCISVTRRGDSFVSSPVSMSAHSAGVTVSATIIEATTAMMKVSAIGPMKRPCTPPANRIGRNTKITASVP